MGGIGQEVAKRMVAFGMRIQYHNRTPLPDGKNPTSATYVSFEGLLRTSDVISVHVPLNQSTRHGIGAEELEKMKPGAILINTARGSILDEGAVALALEQNQLSSVGLDVFEKEPDVHEDLRRNDRCFLTPHIGAATVDTQRSMETVALRNASTAILSGRLETPVAESKEVEEKVATEEECSV